MKTPYSVFRRRMLSRHGEGFALVVALTAIVLITVIVLAFFSKALLNRQISFSSTNQIKSDMLARTALDIIVGEVRQEIVDFSSAPTNGIYFAMNSTNMIPTKTGVTGADSSIGTYTIAKVGVADSKIDPGTNGKTFGSDVSIDTKSRNGRSLPQWYTSGPRLGTASLPSWTYLTRSGQVATNITPSEKNPSGTNFVTGRFSYTVYNVGGLLNANIAGYPSNTPAVDAGSKGSSAFADLTALGLSQSQIDSLVAWRNPTTGSSTNLYRIWATGINSTNTNSAAKLAAIPAATGYLSTVPGDNAFFSRRDLLRFMAANNAPTNAPGSLTTFSRALTSPSWGPTDPKNSLIEYEKSANLPSSFNRFIPAVAAYDGTMTFYRDDGTPEVIDTTSQEPLIPRRFSLAKLAWLGHDGPNPAAFSSTLSSSDREKAIYDSFGLKWNSLKKRWDYDHGSQKFILSLDEVRKEKRIPDFFELIRAGILSGSLGTNPGTPTSDVNVSDNQAEGVLGNILQLANKKDRQVLQIGANIIDQADRDNYPTAIYQFSNDELTTDDVLYNCVFGVENLPMLSRIGLINYYWPDHGEDIDPGPVGAADMKVFLQPEIWNPHDSKTADPVEYPDTPTQLRFVVLGGASLIMDESVNNGTPTVTFGNNPIVTSFGLDPAAPDVKGTISFVNPSPASGAPRSFFDSPVALTGYSTPAQGSAFNRPEFDYIDYTQPQGPDNRYKIGATRPQWDINIEKGPFVGIYMGTMTRTIPPIYSSGTNKNTSQHGVKVVPDAASGGYLTFVLQYRDKNGNWLPYSSINRVQVLGRQGWSSGSKYGGGWSSNAGRVDPRTDRFSIYHSRVGAGQNETWQKNTTVRSTSASTVAKGDTEGRAAIMSAWPRVGSGFVITGGDKMFDAWLQNLPSSDFRYTDLDGVLRPGDGWRAAATGDTSGDGMMTYELITEAERKNKKNPLDSNIGGYLKDSMFRRRPYILNRPFQSVGELGYVFRDQPFKTLDLLSENSADGALLDLFSIAETPEVQAGRVNPHLATPAVLESLFRGTQKQANLTTSAMTSTEATAIAQAATLELSGTSGTARNASTIARRLGGPSYSAATGVPGNNTLTYQPFRNKTYGESHIRALANTTDTRTWNLLVDIVSQPGKLAANATSLGDYIVEGERRYWLHIAIDRLTGMVIDSQLEAVYE